MGTVFMDVRPSDVNIRGGIFYLLVVAQHNTPRGLPCPADSLLPGDHPSIPFKFPILFSSGSSNFTFSKVEIINSAWHHKFWNWLE